MGETDTRRYVVNGIPVGHPVRTEQVRIPMDDDVDPRRHALPPRRPRRRSLAGRPRVDPVPQGRLDPVARLAAPRGVRRGRLRQLPPRRPGDREQRGDRRGRVHRAGDRRQPRRDRLAGDTAVEHRDGRHVRDQLGRLLRAAGGDAPAAGAPGDRPGLLQPRPLPRGRPLVGRRPPRRRERLLARRDGRRECAAARPRALWPGLAGGVAASARRHAAVAAGVAPPPAPRRALDPRLRDRGLGLDRGGRPRPRRPQRLVSRQRPGDGGERPGARPRDSRPVGARLAARRGARADDRRRRAHDPLVGPLAQGRAQRGGGGAGARRPRRGARTG